LTHESNASCSEEHLAGGEGASAPRRGVRGVGAGVGADPPPKILLAIEVPTPHPNPSLMDCPRVLVRAT
jgi:hypothetical protein